MDLKTLKIQVWFQDKEDDTSVAEKWNEENKQELEIAKEQIADYIQTFNNIPNKNIWFESDKIETYHVRRSILNPSDNAIRFICGNY